MQVTNASKGQVQWPDPPETHPIYHELCQTEPCELGRMHMTLGNTASLAQTGMCYQLPLHKDGSL